MGHFALTTSVCDINSLLDEFNYLLFDSTILMEVMYSSLDMNSNKKI